MAPNSPACVGNSGRSDIGRLVGQGSVDDPSQWRRPVDPVRMMAMTPSARSRFDTFVESARAFCAWVERLPSLPSDDLRDLDEALALLSTLLADGYGLPVVEPTDAEIPDVPESEWGAVLSRALTWSGASDSYWTVEPGGSEAAEPTLGSIADDVADTWRDLHRCLSLIHISEPTRPY